MSNSILSNIAAFNAQGNIAHASNKASASIARLSSGNRIVSASDDVAGLATGTALRTQVTTLRTALANAAQGNSLLQVADGALSQIVDILQRQKAIASQASSGQLTDTNRSLLNQEFQNLVSEIDRISVATNFNGVGLLAGGLGAKTSLARTDALAVASTLTTTSSGTVVAAQATTAIQAYDSQAGTAKTTSGTTGGHLTITDSGGTTLANSSYLTVDSNLYGQFTSFEFSNVTYGATTAGSATLTATINGQKYTGNVIGGSANVSAVLQNGTTYIKVGVGAADFSNQATTDNTRTLLIDSFKTTTIAKVYTISGVDFTGTALVGATGSTTYGVATARLTSNSADIGNFKYAGAQGSTDTSIVTVQINGKTFTASTVDDTLAAGDTIQFVDDAKLQSLTINLTGLDASLTNIRTDSAARDKLIAALNQGFSKAGAGLNFSVGTAATDTIRVALSSVSTSSIYSNNTLDVTSASNAQFASNIIDSAINAVISLRATVGALQSRFNFASNAIQSSIENQDAARSSILDTDVSAESTDYSSAQVQLQAGISVLAQANQLTQSLLKLIQ